ncbi:MAG: Flp pilus assembly CpaB [Burkholderiaceae bacterium]|nr:Flp pilus assembly CpaB [Burkholderiaceae bacterium]
MKSTRALIMIGVSIVVAIIAVVLASRWISQQSSINTSKLVVAATDINPGTRLTPEIIKLSDWPSGSVLKDSFSDLKLLENRVARISLQKGEPLTEPKLAPVGSTGGLSAIVAEGKRAMTVRVNDVIGVAGFALPGNYVDILVSTKDDSRAQPNAGGVVDPSVSKLVLEKILVLAVEQEARQDQTKPKVVNAVTLEVTPEQAEKLDLARSIGQLSLVLRNQVDNKPAMTDGATKKTLLRTKEEQVAEKPVAEAPKTPRKAAKTAPRKARWCQQIQTGSGMIEQCY